MQFDGEAPFNYFLTGTPEDINMPDLNNMELVQIIDDIVGPADIWYVKATHSLLTRDVKGNDGPSFD
jgi:hypothetical protein